jgi:hypothetical protein
MPRCASASTPQLATDSHSPAPTLAGVRTGLAGGNQFHPLFRALWHVQPLHGPDTNVVVLFDRFCRPRQSAPYHMDPTTSSRQPRSRHASRAQERHDA